MPWERRQRKRSCALTHFSALAVIALVFASAGCGEDSVISDSPPTVPLEGITPSEFPVGLEWRRLEPWAHPTSLYEATYELWQAATAVCMADRGFSYVPVAYIDDSEAFVLTNPLNEAVASAFGYHLPELGLSIEDEQRGTEEFNSALLGANEAGSGSPPGCSEVAFRFAYDFPEAIKLSTLGDSLRNEVDTGIEGFDSSPAGVAALGAWKTCMLETGYEFDRPIDANTRYSEEASVSDEEVAVRLADLRCDRLVKLTEQRSQFESDRRRSIVSANAESVNEITELTNAVTKIIVDRTLALRTDGANAFSG